MKDPLRLRKSFKAGTKNDPRDVETIANALRVTGFLPRQKGGAPAPSAAAVGGALRSFQDREGLVVDGLVRPGGATERHLSRLARRRAALAARPPRKGSIRFGTLTAENDRESRGMARGIVRRDDHRGAVAILRQVFEDDSGDALPEAMQLADRVEDLDRKQGARFRADLVKMLGEVQPTLAPLMASGRIPEGGSTHVGASLLSPVASGAKSTASERAAKAAGDERAAPAGNRAAKAQTGGDMADMFKRIVPPTIADRTGDAQNRMANPPGGPDEGLIRKGFDPSLPEAEREELQGARNRASQILLGSHIIGRNLARENYVHYLRASGEDKVWSRERMRGIEPFRRAEIANRQAFPAKIAKDWETGLLGLKEGERIRLSEVVVTESFTSPKDKLDDSILETRFDNDFMLAFGGLNFKAIGSLTAVRRGNVITIRGLVRHGFQDKYDFDFLFKDEAEVLERHGEAKTYVNKAEWYQEVEGTFRIVGGNLVAQSFRWTDASTEGGGPRDR